MIRKQVYVICDGEGCPAMTGAETFATDARHARLQAYMLGYTRTRERVATTPCGAKGGTVLPTPTARDGDGRGTGDAGHWDRRLRTGRTNGFPLDATVALLPTPSAVSYGSDQGGAAGRVGSVRHSLDSMAKLDLLPTPTVGDSRNSRNATAGRSEGQGHHHSGTTLSDVAHVSGQLLPSPRASDGVNGGPRHAGRSVAAESGPCRGRPGRAEAMSSAVQPDNWGRFALAVARHAAIYGPPPAPTEPNRNGAPRLAPAFAEWLMCLPAGHVTSKLGRVAALKAIGNGVCPPQLAAAWALLTDTTAILDASLGRRVASGAVTTSQEVKEIQERGAAARARVLDAASAEDLKPAQRIEAAMMELAAVWREDADAVEKAKRRGHVATAKELRQAAARLAGFAVGLTTRPSDWIPPAVPELINAFKVDSRTDTEREADEQAALTREAELGLVRAFRNLADVPVPSDPVMDFLTGKTDTYTPAPRPEQILDELKRAPVITPSMLAVDNPFTSPGPPGANRAPVAAVPYAALDGLARKLAADSPRDHVSHSYVRDYESCSLQALLSDASRAQVIGARRPGWSLIGGSAFHSAVEFIEHAVLAGDLQILDHTGTSVIHNLDEFWGNFLDAEIKNTMERVAGGPYADPSTWYTANGGREGFDWWRIEGAAMLKAYLSHHDAAWREKHKILMVADTTPAIELPYTMAVRSLDGSTSYEAQGFIDSAWLSLDDYHITIVDYKTGKTGPAETFQLGEYAHALLMLMGLAEAPPGRPILASYWLARKGIYTPPIDAITAHPLVELQYRYGAAMRGTRAGIFTPHLTNLCNSCGVRDYCPAQVAR